MKFLKTNILLLSIFFALSFSKTVLSYNVETHGLINKVVAQTTLPNGFSLNNYLEKQLDLTNGVEEKFNNNDVLELLGIAGDTATALNYFVAGSRNRYSNTFAELGSNKINSIFSNISTMVIKDIYDVVANCRVVRKESGGSYAYPVTFIKDDMGMWKIMGS